MSVRRRSRRSFAVQFALVFATVIAIYLWLTNGGPEAFGVWFADYLISGS